MISKIITYNYGSNYLSLEIIINIQKQCQLAYIMSILLILKQYLRVAYLSDSKPDDSSKDKLSRRMDVEFKLNSLHPSTDIQQCFDLKILKSIYETVSIKNLIFNI